MVILRFLIISVLTLSCQAAFGQDFRGRCVGVSSGDTLEVIKGPRRVTVHLAGVAAPELNQPFGLAAHKALVRFALDRELLVQEQVRDRGGVIHAIVLDSAASTPSLNMALVRCGLAWCETSNNLVKGLDACERQARADHCGLWLDPAPVPPWHWKQLAAGQRPKMLFTPEGKPVETPQPVQSEFERLVATQNPDDDGGLLEAIIRNTQRQANLAEQATRREFLARTQQRLSSMRFAPPRRTRSSGGLSYGGYESWSYYPQPQITRMGNVGTISSGINMPQGLTPGVILER